MLVASFDSIGLFICIAMLIQSSIKCITFRYRNVSKLFSDFCSHRTALINELKSSIDNSTGRWRVFVSLHIVVDPYHLMRWKISLLWEKKNFTIGNEFVGNIHIEHNKDKTDRTSWKNWEKNLNFVE